jgi:hypothetical protein
MTDYAPTVNPGDTRRRCRFIGIRVPLDTRTNAEKAANIQAPPPQVEVLEEDVIRTAQQERVLEVLGNLPVGTFDLSETFPILNPENDGALGGNATVGQAFTLIHSWVRHKQTLRDTAEALVP